jgi:hypothetical protein
MLNKPPGEWRMEGRATAPLFFRDCTCADESQSGFDPQSFPDEKQKRSATERGRKPKTEQDKLRDRHQRSIMTLSLVRATVR